MRTLKELAQEALGVQNACNPLGISRSYGEAMLALRDALQAANLPNGTDDLCNHPIARLWAAKIVELHRMGLADLDRYGEADKACQALAQGD